MNQENLQTVDHAALKVNQAVIIILSTMAFIANLPWLAAFVAIVMGFGTLRKKPGFLPIYRMLKRAGWATPDLLSDNPEPHRFAQGFGTIVLAVGVGLLYRGASVLGWGLVWLVIVLAALNYFAGFCVGCALYYWLARVQIPGFVKSPPSGVFPGMRPKVSVDHGN